MRVWKQVKLNLEDLRKVKKLFQSPALKRVVQWSKCVHTRIILICAMNVILVLSSLAVTLITKELVDAAVSTREDAIWRFGILLVVIILA